MAYEVTDQNIRSRFGDTADFICRELACGRYTLYAYGIDGLISSADASDYVIKPILEDLSGNMEQLHERALRRTVYNTVAAPCKDLADVVSKLLNGFCVVLFPQVGAVAFEVKTGEKRGISRSLLELCDALVMFQLPWTFWFLSGAETLQQVCSL